MSDKGGAGMKELQAIHTILEAYYQRCGHKVKDDNGRFVTGSHESAIDDSVFRSLTEISGAMEMMGERGYR